MSGLMTALGGVSLLQVAADAVHLMLTTPLSSSAGVHENALCLSVSCAVSAVLCRGAL